MRCGENIWSYFLRNFQPSREALENPPSVVFAELDWTPDIYQQSQSRLHRGASITVDEA
jgi:hypothetical protein